MPWLSTLHPIGDTSPLTRFVIGLDEALKAYPGTAEDPLLKSSGPFPDPWSEDLFYPHLPVQPPVLGPGTDSPREAGSPQAVRLTPRQNALWTDRAFGASLGDLGRDEPGGQPSAPLARFGAGFELLTGLLAAVVVAPVSGRYASRKAKEPDELVPAKRQRDRG